MTALPAARGIIQIDEVNARASLFQAQGKAAATPVGSSWVETSVNPDISF